MPRCSACDPSCRLVSGVGPLPSPILLIGEKPGQDEDRMGIPFVGLTGKELDRTYLPLAGLDRCGVRVTNTVKCRLGGNNNAPSAKQITACAGEWLAQEVRDCEPSLIVLLGATACSLVPRIELEKDHGYPLWITAADSELLGGYEGWVMASYHPASGLHDSSQMIPLLEDFERLKWWREGKWSVPVGSLEQEYRLLHSPVVLPPSPYNFLPVDTEDDDGVPWSLQFSTAPGNGYMIYARDRIMMDWFRREVLPRFSGMYLHFAAHDLDVMEQMGVDTSGLRFYDTMQEAYQLGNLPQKLKSLGWRLLGIRMRSWEDVVLPHSHAVMRDWLLSEWDRLTENRIRVEIKQVRKTKILWKPTEAERDIRRILSHSHKPAYDLWKKAEEAGLSGYPKKSIRHVPEDEAVIYACQDADVTGQVSLELGNRRAEVMEGEWHVAGEDRDR